MGCRWSGGPGGSWWGVGVGRGGVGMEGEVEGEGWQGCGPGVGWIGLDGERQAGTFIEGLALGRGAWLRIPLYYWVGACDIWEIVSLGRLVVKVLVGDGALAGKVLTIFAKSTGPLLGLALSHPVPHLSIEVTNQILTLCWGLFKAATLVAGTRLTLVFDSKPLRPNSE